MPNPNIGKEGKDTRFSSTNQPSGRGRPKKIITRFKEAGYSKDDVRITYSNIAGMTIEEIEVILLDPTITVLETTIARAFLDAAADGKYAAVKDIIEAFADKPKQSVDVVADNKVEVKITYTNEGL